MSIPERPGYAKGRATREEILDAAMGLFGEAGYSSASLREVASRVGISHPGLLYHFASKSALLESVLQRRDEAESAAIQENVDGGAGYVDALLRLVERDAERPGVVELSTVLAVEATSPAHPAHSYFQGRYTRVLRSVADDLADHEDPSGRLPSGLDSTTAARLLVALVDGLHVQWLLEADSSDRVDVPGTLRAFYSLLVEPAHDA